MANLLSPGVQVTEIDASTVTPTEGDSASVFGGNFEKGPIGTHLLISTVAELRDHYGYPNQKNYNDYYQVQNFLAYSGAIYVSRAADMNGTPTLLESVTFNSDAFVTNATITPIEDVNFIKKEAENIAFEKTDKFTVGQTLRFGESGKEYKVKFVRNESRLIPNPDYKPLTQLNVEPNQASAYVDEVVRFEVTTDAETFTAEADRPDVVLVNKSNKSLTALKVGPAVITFRATKEGARENTFELRFDVQEKENTKLIVSPTQLNVVKGTQRVLNIDTDAEDYTITSRNLAILSIENDKRTISGKKIGSTLIDITAQAEGKLQVTETISVSVIEDRVTSLTVNPEGPVSIRKGETQSFEITSDGNFILEYADEADKEFIIVDSNTHQVIAKKEGNAVVQVRAEAVDAAEVTKRIQIIVLPNENA